MLFLLVIYQLLLLIHENSLYDTELSNKVCEAVLYCEYNITWLKDVVSVFIFTIQHDIECLIAF